MFIEKFSYEFNYELINKKVQKINNVNVLSFEHQLALSIIANQINDNGFYYKTIALRNAYDVFLLSKKTNAKSAMNTLDKLRHPLNCFLAACYEVFNKVDSLEYSSNSKIDSYLKGFNSNFINKKATKRRHKLITIYLFIKLRLNIVYKGIIYKEYRAWLFNIVTDKNWLKEKIIQLGMKW